MRTASVADDRAGQGERWLALTAMQLPQFYDDSWINVTGAFREGMKLDLIPPVEWRTAYQVVFLGLRPSDLCYALVLRRDLPKLYPIGW